MSSFGLSFLCLFLGSTMRFSLAADQCAMMQQVLQEQTPHDQLGPFYVANSPVTSLMGPEDLLNDPGRRLEVRGRVLSSIDCTIGLAGVSVEMWYAGDPDEDGDYYQDEEYRGQVVTDECGFYRLVQAFPALYPTRPILHDHFRLSRDGQELLVTQMYFIGTNEGFVSSDVREMQAVSIIQDANGTRSVEFNMYVDLEEVSNSASCQGVAVPRLEPKPVQVEYVGVETQSSISSTSNSDSIIPVSAQFIFSMFFVSMAMLL